MPLYVQNGKLLQKSGALGTSAGCCCETCPCSDGMPTSVFVTINDMSGIDVFFSASAASALKAVLLGNTYELTRECTGNAFVYQTGTACGSVICSDITQKIRIQFLLTTAGNHLLVEAWADSPCVFVYGRQGTRSFTPTTLSIDCDGGSAELQVWNECLNNNYRVADVLLEW
jgi:hypothetical protein